MVIRLHKPSPDKPPNSKAHGDGGGGGGEATQNLDLLQHIIKMPSSQ